MWTFTSNGDGDVVEGKITRMTNFGAFVELDEGIEGAEVRHPGDLAFHDVTDVVP